MSMRRWPGEQISQRQCPVRHGWPSRCSIGQRQCIVASVFKVLPTLKVCRWWFEVGNQEFRPRTRKCIENEILLFRGGLPKTAQCVFRQLRYNSNLRQTRPIVCPWFLAQYRHSISWVESPPVQTFRNFPIQMWRPPKDRNHVLHRQSCDCHAECDRNCYCDTVDQTR